MRLAPLLPLFAWLLANDALAQAPELHGYVDFRAVAAPDTRSFTDGGLGKTRYGEGDSTLQFGGAALDLAWQLAPEWLAVGSVQAQTTDESTIDLLEAYVRYRPVSTTPFRWSMKLGAFFPPVSLENDAVGWTSRMTLTPSAINSWVGEEVRIFGGEARGQWRHETHTFEAAAAVFAGNDPAGELLAGRGWSLSDLAYGYGSTVREPDALVLVVEDGAPPFRFDPFVENDDRIGWYGELALRSRTHGQVRLLYYDNRADPESFSIDGGREVYSWNTSFWSLGAETRVGDVVLLGQAMVGDTAFQPSPFFHSETSFRAAYVLAALERGAWRPALRLDFFNTHQHPSSGDEDNEHGNALTLALNWRPREWLRVTAEALRVDSSRTTRPRVGLPESSVDTQVQLSARLLF